MQDFMNFIIKHWELSAAAVVVLLLILVEEFRGKVGGGNRLVPAEVTNLVNHEDAVAIDVREVNAYQNGHIAGAINMPQLEIQNDLKKLDKYKMKPVIFVCSNGQKSHALAVQLQKQGFEKVFSLAGGIPAWTQAELPLVKK